jgi:prophage antirepressor-like protein
MNELKVFKFEEGRKVRTLERDGEPWFAHVDACAVLGHTNPTKALQMLDDDEKDVITRASDPNLWLGSLGGPGREGGAQALNIINESGLYNLIFRSNKPEARTFRKWVTSVVLPSIRSKGYYALDKQVLERLDKMEARHEKFKEQTVAAYKKLEARVGEYVDGLDNMADKARSEVIEYLVSSHKPSAHEAQLADLKQYLSLTIAATGDKRDKIDLFRLYPGYEAKCANPLPKDAFAAQLLLLYPQIKFSSGSGTFSGCRFDY